MSSAAMILASSRRRMTAGTRHHHPWRTRSQQHLPLQAVRSYYYLPTSWPDFQERFQRWIESTTKQQQRRMVKVQLLRRKQPSVTNFIGRNQTQWKSWVQRQKQKLPKTTSRYQGWKTRRKELYQGWKTRRKEQYQGWKTRRKELYQGWKARRIVQYQTTRANLLLRTKQIALQEYSQPEWFDSLGRPLTARDSTGRFVNPWRSQSTNGIHSVTTIVNWRLQRMARNLQKWGLWGSLVPKLSWNTALPKLPASSPPLPQLAGGKKTQLTWMGHSTCYIQTQGISILMDPMFSLRASPYQWFPIGVPRELPPSHSIQELVEHNKGTLDLCCITHDHYDHLDYDSVLELKAHVQLWVVPLGLADWLVEKCDIPRSQIVELEWWQQVHLQKDTDGKIIQKIAEENKNNDSTTALTITCCPASHWASRSMMDRNQRLWCSFAIHSSSPEANNSTKLFVCGDTGYPKFPLFRQIGDALGPFDLAALPIGAYLPSEMNKEAHVHPQEALQIHKDIRSQHSVAIHWGTFPLSEEELEDPPKELQVALSNETTTQSVMPFTTLQHGGTIEVSAKEVEKGKGNDDYDDDYDAYEAAASTGM